MSAASDRNGSSLSSRQVGNQDPQMKYVHLGNQLAHQLATRLAYARFKVENGWQSKRIEECENLLSIRQQRKLASQPLTERGSSVSSATTLAVSESFRMTMDPPMAASANPGYPAPVPYPQPSSSSSSYAEPFPSYATWQQPAGQYADHPTLQQQGSSKDHMAYPLTADPYLAPMQPLSNPGSVPYFPSYDPYGASPPPQPYQPPAHRKLSRPSGFSDGSMSSPAPLRSGNSFSDFLRAHPHSSNSHLPLSQPGGSEVTFAELDSYYGTPHHAASHAKLPIQTQPPHPGYLVNGALPVGMPQDVRAS